MSDLEVRIRERLDDWVENALNPGALADALTAVLAHCDEADDSGCWAVSVGLVRAAIARALGIKEDND